VLSRYITIADGADFPQEASGISGVSALLITMVTVMLVFLITFVVPKFADLFNNLGADLPAITVFMLTIA